MKEREVTEGAVDSRPKEISQRPIVGCCSKTPTINCSVQVCPPPEWLLRTLADCPAKLGRPDRCVRRYIEGAEVEGRHDDTNNQALGYPCD